jgi:hypothetical protein
MGIYCNIIIEDLSGLHSKRIIKLIAAAQVIFNDVATANTYCD